MNNNYALITGASNGIGYELTRFFGKDGINMILVARSEDKLNDLANQLKTEYDVDVQVIAVDLSNPDAVNTIYQQTTDKEIRVEYLVNNAGFGDHGLFIKTDWEKENRMIDLNVKSLTYLSKLYGKDMAYRKSGNILNLASTASFQPGPFMNVYFATKHYVLAFSEALDNELKRFNVSVTALCPGPTESGFQKNANVEDSDFANRNIPTSKEVAEFGYKKMMKRKTVAIHGLKNRMLAASVRFLPRKVVTNITAKMMK
jgi:short-subunit dehydrogenase